MRFHLSADEKQIYSRIKYLRGGLIGSGHTVRLARPAAPPAKPCDVWLHGVSPRPEVSIRPDLVQAMLSFPGRLVFFKTDDCTFFPLDSIHEALRSRASCMLANFWQNGADVPELADYPTGLITPFLDPLDSDPGRDLVFRENRVVFYGAQTGVESLPDGSNARAAAIRRIRDAGIPFLGGITFWHEFDNDMELLAPRLPKREFMNLLGDSTICLALWGNARLTYRLFEGLSRRAIVVCQSLRDVRFADAGLEPGEHYLEVRADLADLEEVLDHAMSNLESLQAMADRGHALFRERCAYSGIALPRPLVDQITATWGDWMEPVASPSLKNGVLRRLLPRVKNLPNV
jgi:glycosyl transferase family 1